MSTSHLVIELSGHQMFAVPQLSSNLTTAAGRLYTSLSGQQRLELVIWEDSSGMASPRTFVGVAVMTLPVKLPLHTPLDILLQQNGCGNVTVTVTVNGQPEISQTSHVIRRVWDTSRLAHLLHTYGDLTELQARWETELTPAERRQTDELVERLDQVLAGEAIDDEALDRVVYESETVAHQLAIIRARDVLIAALLVYGRKYLTPMQERRLLQIQSSLSAARQQGDLLGSMALIEEHDGEIDSLGGPMLLLVYAKATLESRRLPVSSATSLEVAMGNVEQGVSQKNEQQIGHGLIQLMYSFEGTIQALKQHQQPLNASWRPIDTVP